MSDNPFVTIGVPVYRGELYIKETLHSIRAQTHQNIEVVISLDGPQPDAEELCQPFLKDSRFRVVVQPERIGWVGNLNYLMAQVKTPFWYFNPQDDLVDPNYVDTLLEYAQQLPEAAVVYCDLVDFGLRSGTMKQPSVTGSPFARQFKLLHEHTAAVAFRGLTRIEAIRLCGNIRANEIDDFATDTTWMAAMARWGELQRVPAGLYHKRYHPENEHTKWSTWPAEKFTKAWMIHCADMLEQAMLVDATTSEKRFLWLAGVGRLLSSKFTFLPSSNYTSAERLLLLDAFCEHLQAAGHIDIQGSLEDDWSRIKQWSQGFY